MSPGSRAGTPRCARTPPHGRCRAATRGRSPDGRSRASARCGPGCDATARCPPPSRGRKVIPRSASTISTRVSRLVAEKRLTTSVLRSRHAASAWPRRPMPVFEQQHAAGVQPVEVRALRVHETGFPVAREAEGIAKERQHFGAAQVEGKREQEQVQATRHQVGVDAGGGVLVQVEPELRIGAAQAGDARGAAGRARRWE